MISVVFAFLPYPLTLGILVASMVAAVVLAASLELRTPPRRRVLDSWSGVTHSAPTLPANSHERPTRHGAGTDVELPHERMFISNGQSPIEPGGDSGTVLMLGATGSAQDTWIELGPLGSDIEIAGVLFAAYVASQGPECSRVTGWVRASADLPSPEGISSGERIRGKPAKVRMLLECSEEARNWVTVDERTDIALAVDRRPPRDAVLVGLVHWWRLSVSSTAELAPDEVSAVRFAISAVKRELRANPLADRIREVIEVCRVADAAGVGLVAHLVPAGRIRSEGAVEHTGDSPDHGEHLDGAPLEQRVAL